MFADLMRRDKKEAFEYRFRTLWEPIPSEYALTTSSPQEEPLESVLEGPCNRDGNKELIHELKTKLIEAGVKYHHLSGETKLKALVLEHNL